MALVEARLNYGRIGIFSIIHEYYRETAPTAIKAGIVVSHQWFGNLMRWNPWKH
jgi:hypothetical protein